MPSILNPQKQAQSILLDRQTHAITLVAAVLDRYGSDAMDWHPRTLRLELEQDFHVELPTILGDKLNAGIDILTSDGFFKQPAKFIQYCNVLSGSHPSLGVFDPADAMECAWGITEAMMIYAPDEDEPFSQEIRYYIGKVLDDEGIKTPPDVLKIGLHDKGAEFGDMPTDPEMFQASFEVQSDEAAEISQLLRSELRQVLVEIQEFPFENGNSENLLSKLRAGSQ